MTKLLYHEVAPHTGHNLDGFDPVTSPIESEVRFRGCIVRSAGGGIVNAMQYAGQAYALLQKQKLLVGEDQDVVVTSRSFPWAAYTVQSIAGVDIITIWTPPPEYVPPEPEPEPKIVSEIEEFLAWDLIGSIEIFSLEYAEMIPYEYMLIEDVRTLKIADRLPNPYVMTTAMALVGAASFPTPLRFKELVPVVPLQREGLRTFYPHHLGYSLYEWNKFNIFSQLHAPDIDPWGIFRPCIQNWGSEENPVKGPGIARVAENIDTTTLEWPAGYMAESMYWIECCTSGRNVIIWDATAWACPAGVTCTWCAINVIMPALGPNSGTWIGSWDTITIGIWHPQAIERGDGEFVFELDDPEVPYVKLAYTSEDRFAYGATSEDGRLSCTCYQLTHDWTEDWEVREYFILCKAEGSEYLYKAFEDHTYSESERMDKQGAIRECTIYESGSRAYFLFTTVRKEFPWDGDHNEQYFLQYHVITFYDKEFVHYQSRELQGSLESYPDPPPGSVPSEDGVTGEGLVPYTFRDPITGADITKYNPGTFRLVRRIPTGMSF